MNTLQVCSEKQNITLIDYSKYIHIKCDQKITVQCMKILLAVRGKTDGGKPPITIY